ncbi:Histone-like bacterial DNA-binding protein [Candidatus Magnetobacterium bavaricum]|uniref:Histone-like bacterial DNA-binding protein n=1 Tax=Candidatus Magnetobacterium bavaricum TaxID=29290 RepID=A0A0F3GN87_9BACT|nr:Histone-like bacterial DNA-binding protein [Candidatus Magnetobacterium bavaricum]
MTKSELVLVVMEKSPGLTRTQTEFVVDAFFQCIMDALNSGDKVEIRGFGNFRLKDRAPRRARNPKTGEIVEVPAKKILHFKMGKELRELINA